MTREQMIDKAVRKYPSIFVVYEHVFHKNWEMFSRFFEQQEAMRYEIWYQLKVVKLEHDAA